MRNMARINNYANRIAARQDWGQLAKRAHELGLSDMVRKLEPPPDATWRKIDKQIAELRRFVEQEKGD